MYLFTYIIAVLIFIYCILKYFFLGRQWTYQTCTEFGFFQTSTARPKLFSETFPVDFFVQQCVDIFGPRFI